MASPKTAQKRPILLMAICAGILLPILSLAWIHTTQSEAQTAILIATPTKTDATSAAIAHAPTSAIRSIAVLPFQDLTDQMNEEPFADGMSEELIDKLSKVPGLAVSPPPSSFYFKNKQATIADVSKALHVEFVLDGSVRKSGNKLRVAARLTRAQDGFVAWSETYDRSWHDKLMIQDDIANEVALALATSIH